MTADNSIANMVASGHGRPRGPQQAADSQTQKPGHDAFQGYAGPLSEPCAFPAPGESRPLETLLPGQSRMRVDPTAQYVLFWGGQFSNWYKSAFTIGSKNYTTVEQFMMAEKARLFQDFGTRNKILAEHNPRAVKKLGRAVRNFDDRLWQRWRYAIVCRGVREKFAQSPDLQKILLDTGDRMLVEASPEDHIWGIGRDEADPLAADWRSWNGTNLLGFALMEARETLRQRDSGEGRAHGVGAMMTLLKRESECEESGAAVSIKGVDATKQHPSDAVFTGYSAPLQEPRVFPPPRSACTLATLLGGENSRMRVDEEKEYVLFWGGCYSNWHKSPFAVGNHRYTTVEQFMMAEKARLFGDIGTRDKILAENNPKKVKALGRAVRGFDEKVWQRWRYAIVCRGVQEKFTQSEELRRNLLDTTERMLVEASPHDRIWGVGRGEEDPLACDWRTWNGTNLLGFALMEAREMLRRQDGKDATTERNRP